MKKEKKIKAWGITDWGGGIEYPSVSIFDTKEAAQEALKFYDKLPDPTIKGERNKIVKVEIKIIK